MSLYANYGIEKHEKQPLIQKKENETAKAYSALVAFASLGTGRSLDNAVALCHSIGDKTITLKTLKNWSHRNSWPGRVASYDQAMAEGLLEAVNDAKQARHLAEIKEFGDTHKEFGKRAFRVADKALRACEEFMQNKLEIKTIDDLHKVSSVVKNVEPMIDKWAQTIAIDRMLNSWMKEEEAEQKRLEGDDNGW